MQISPYHGNIAPFILFVLVPFTLYLFATKKPSYAAMIIGVGFTLLGPVGAWIKVPLTPHINRDNLPFLSAVLALAIFHSKLFWKSKPGRGPEALMWLSVLSSLMTWKTNTDTQVFGSWIQRVLPGMTFIDGMAMGIDHIFLLAAPFLVGRIVFSKYEDLEQGLRFYVCIGLLYTIPILYELKMSPVVHDYVYGYPASYDFLAVLRWGGYRPMVCMPNGLALSMMMLQIGIAAAALLRAKVRITKRMSNKAALSWLIVILVLCKSTGAIMYGVVFFPMLVKGKLKTQLRTAYILSAIAISYPILRSAELVPVQEIVSAFEVISKDRAGSLGFRFDNEEILAEKARRRYLFGWGTYGRNSIYHEEIGKEMTIADGYWVILLGVRGLVGFFLSFILALYPVFVAVKVIPRIPDEKTQFLLSAVALIVAVSIFDLIPNGLFTNYNYFFAGILYGMCRALDPKGKIQQRRRRTSRPSPAAGTAARPVA